MHTALGVDEFILLTTEEHENLEFGSASLITKKWESSQKSKNFPKHPWGAS
jgi:hypothetical protein